MKLGNLPFLSSLAAIVALGACTDAMVDDTANAPDANAPDGNAPDGICSPNEVPIGLELIDIATADGIDPSSGANGMAINNRGDITGVMGSKAFLWRAAESPLVQLDGDEDSMLIRGHGVSEAGDVVGHGLARPPGSSSGFGATAFYWSEETGHRLLGEPGHSYAYGMNNLGLAVGSSGASGTVWDVATGEVIAELTVDGASVQFHDINDAGVAVGKAGASVVVWTAEEGLRALPGMGGGLGWARAVNEDGFIAAEGDDELGIGRCMIYDPADDWSEPIDLGLLTEPWLINWCMVEGINIHREVVGGDRINGPGQTQAWVWQDGVKTNLNDLLTAEQRADWHLHKAMAINDYGVTTGIATYQGHGSAFVATPICE